MSRRRAPSMPRLPQLESTWDLLRDPYRFIGRHCRRLGSDAFEARVALRPTICMSGPDAAALFYDETRFLRRGAMPEPVRATLLGKGGVQGLDGEPHRHRKRMFLSMMGEDRVSRFGCLLHEEWEAEARSWAGLPKVVLYEAVQPLLVRAACRWVGVVLTSAEARVRTRQLVALFDAAGPIGPRHVGARLARTQAERWLANLISEIRSGEKFATEGSPLYTVVFHRDLSGELLSPRVAAVELINLLRPLAAISVYLTFAAHALESYGDYAVRLRSDPDFVGPFAQEIRRYYPFFPAVVATTRTDFEWQGMPFQRGRRVLLDLHGTNHDTRIWVDPDHFRPERFIDTEPGPYEFVPQGGGRPALHHRCPGEKLTTEAIRVSTAFLVGRLRYTLPKQDLTVDWSRLPALPKSGMILSVVTSA